MRLLFKTTRHLTIFLHCRVSQESWCYHSQSGCGGSVFKACCQHINFQVSSSNAQAQGVEKKSDLHLFGWKHLNAVILYCYHSNENNQDKKNITFYTKEYRCTVNKLLLMFSITFNNNQVYFLFCNGPHLIFFRCKKELQWVEYRKQRYADRYL